LFTTTHGLAGSVREYFRPGAVDAGAVFAGEGVGGGVAVTVLLGADVGVAEAGAGAAAGGAEVDVAVLDAPSVGTAVPEVD